MGRTDTTDLGGRRKRHTGRTCHRKHTSRSGCRCQQQEGYACSGFVPAAMEEVSPPSSSSGGKSVLHGKYEMGRLLGHGSFAKVYYARNIHTGRSVAMKVVGKEKVVKAGMMEQVKREIAVMKMVTCPNIVELYEVMATRSKIYFAMELVRGGELFSKIARGGRLPEDTARRYFRQLISAVDFCHSRGVYHRDLKLENLLLDDGGDLKVADFGLSAFADHRRADGLLHTTCGTPAYVAPEVIGKRGYDGAKADLWSCGVILYVLLAGFLPFQDDNIVSLYKKIHRGDFRCPNWFSSEARRLVTKLLDPDPNTRITAAKLMETPWFKRPVGDPVELISRVEEDHHGGKNNTRRKEIKEPRTLNAFHIISLSPGLDLSPLFEDGDEYRRAERAEGIRFATAEPARVVISRLEAVAAKAAGRFTVTTEIFTVVSSVLVVEVRKEGGDTAEYRSFCSNELWPALEDIVLGFPNSLQKATATTTG